MSDVVIVALITGGFTLVAPLAALWLNGYAERKRTRLEFKANMKAKMMDYEREDRLAIVRPLRDYLDDLGRTLAEISVEEFMQSPQAGSQRWYIRVCTQVLRGSTLWHSIDDGDLRAALQELARRVTPLAGAARDFMKAPPNTEEARDASAQVRQFDSELVPLLRDVYAKLDRYGRQVGIPTLDD